MDGVVYLSGGLCQKTGTNVQFGLLPAAVRPAHNLAIKMFGYGGEAAELVIFSNGQMTASDTFTPGETRNFSSLSAISYPLGS